MSEWKEVLDKSTGKVYYANVKTKAVSWEKPAGYSPPAPAAAPTPAPAPAPEKVAPAPAPTPAPAAAKAEPKAAEWKEVLDKGTGKKYYANLKTKEVRWDPPPSLPPTVETRNPAPPAEPPPEDKPSNPSFAAAARKMGTATVAMREAIASAAASNAMAAAASSSSSSSSGANDTELRLARDEVMKLKGELAAKTKMITEQSVKLSDTLTKYNEQVAKTAEEKQKQESAQQKIQELNLKIQEQTGQISNMSSQLQTASAQVSDFQSQNAASMANNIKLQTQLSQMAAGAGQVPALQAQIIQMTGQLGEAQKQIEELTRACVQANTRAVQAEMVAGGAAEAQVALQVMQGELMRARETANGAKALQGAALKAGEHAKKLQTQLTQVQQEAGGAISSYRKNVAELTRTNDANARMVMELQARISEAERKAAALPKPLNPWKEHTDPNTARPFFFNVITQVTSWEKPEEMTAAAPVILTPMPPKSPEVPNLVDVKDVSFAPPESIPDIPVLSSIVPPPPPGSGAPPANLPPPSSAPPSLAIQFPPPSTPPPAFNAQNFPPPPTNGSGKIQALQAGIKIPSAVGLSIGRAARSGTVTANPPPKAAAPAGDPDLPPPPPPEEESAPVNLATPSSSMNGSRRASYAQNKDELPGSPRDEFAVQTRPTRSATLFTPQPGSPHGDLSRGTSRADMSNTNTHKAAGAGGDDDDDDDRNDPDSAPTPESDEALHAGDMSKSNDVIHTSLDSVKLENFDLDSCARYTMANFARNKFNIHKKGLFSKNTLTEMIQHSEKVIKSPLTKLSNSKLDSEAVQFFRNITGYMGERKSSKAPAGHVQKLLAKGIEGPEELRDEIFCQLVKQTSGNPSKDSLHRGWTLFALCGGVFGPSQEFSKYLLVYFQNAQKSSAGDSHVENFAKFARLRVTQTLENGNRIYVPSVKEIQAVEQRKMVNLSISLVSGEVKQVAVSSQTTVKDVCDAVAKACYLPEDSWGLNQVVTNNGQPFSNTPLADKQRVLDVACGWAPYRKKVEKEAKKGETYNLKFKFMFVCRVFVQSEIDLSKPVALHLYYIQGTYDISNDNLTLPEDKDEFTLAALQMQVDFGDSEAPDQTFISDIGRYLPKRLFDRYARPDLMQTISARRKQYTGVVGDQAKSVYMQTVRAFKEYGVTVFKVATVQSGALPQPEEEIIIGICEKGMYFLDPIKRLSVRKFVRVSEVTECQGDANLFTFTANSDLQIKKHTFSSKGQGQYMMELLEAYRETVDDK